MATLITTDGHFDRAAIMRAAWATFKDCRKYRPEVTFGRRLQIEWDNAKRQRRLWVLSREVAPARMTAIVPASLPRLSAEAAAWIAHQCSTDGRLHAMKLAS